MTTYEVTSADLSASTVYTAQPPSQCLNGCESRQSGAASKVHCELGQLLCPRCIVRLDKWLRAIPDSYALLPAVVEHGTVPSDPGTKHTKRPDPPAPMRLEVIDLLDVRAERGVLGIVHSWAEAVRDQRHDTRPCVCDHARPSHTHRCSAIGCTCHEYRPVNPTVSRECAYLITNLPWCAGQDWAGDLYDEIRVLARTLADTVGEYRPKPVGTCAALHDVPGTWEHGTCLQAPCGGALVMDREGVGVHCLRCHARHEANDGLRELGLLVDSMFRKTGTERQAS
jgi:hypothetical protein